MTDSLSAWLAVARSCWSSSPSSKIEAVEALGNPPGGWEGPAPEVKQPCASWAQEVMMGMMGK